MESVEDAEHRHDPETQEAANAPRKLPSDSNVDRLCQQGHSATFQLLRVVIQLKNAVLLHQCLPNNLRLSYLTTEPSG